MSGRDLNSASKRTTGIPEIGQSGNMAGGVCIGPFHPPVISIALQSAYDAETPRLKGKLSQLTGMLSAQLSFQRKGCKDLQGIFKVGWLPLAATPPFKECQAALSLLNWGWILLLMKPAPWKSSPLQNESDALMGLFCKALDNGGF